MKKIALSAGHGLYTSGKRCSKELDPNETREWTLNSRIAEIIEDILLSYDCEVIRVDDRTGKTDVSLSSRVAIANNEDVDLYISIHHNAGINLGYGGGTVVYCYDSAPREAMANLCYDLLVAQTGLVGNRYTKINDDNDLYEIEKTSMPALLIENGFMDSRTDCPIILTESHAQKSAIGISNFIISFLNLERKEEPKAEYNYDMGIQVDLAPVFDPEFYYKEYADLRAAYPEYDEEKLLDHFITYGMKERRFANDSFNLYNYMEKLNSVYGNDYIMYYIHYCIYGGK